MTPEGKIKKLVTEWLKSKNIPYWSIIPSAYGGSTGMSDLCGILPKGKWLAIEVKARGKRDKVTKLQQKFIDIINDNKGVAVVVSCEEDLRELENSLVYMGIT